MDAIIEIADHYGYDMQSRQLIEEMAELTVAINKAYRAVNFGEPTTDGAKNVMAARLGIIDELADVEIMLEQIIYLMGARYEVSQRKIQKINRQLKRIEKESTC